MMLRGAVGVLCPLQGFCSSTGDPSGSTRCAGLAVPRWPLIPRVLAEAEAGMAAGREAPLFQARSFVCWSRSTAASLPGWAEPERTGDTGNTEDKGCCVVLVMLSSRCSWPRGAAVSPDGFLRSPFPSSKLWVFFLGRKSLRLLSGVWAGEGRAVAPCCSPRAG